MRQPQTEVKKKDSKKEDKKKEEKQDLLYTPNEIGFLIASSNELVTRVTEELLCDSCLMGITKQTKLVSSELT
jgi:hypothetical protein